MSNLINKLKELAKSKIGKDYYRGQIILAKIKYHSFILHEENEMPKEILNLKESTDEIGNINKDNLKTLEGYCYVDFDLDLIGSKYFDLSKQQFNSFRITSATFNSVAVLPTISYEAAFLLPLNNDVESMNHDLSRKLGEDCEECDGTGFEDEEEMDECYECDGSGTVEDDEFQDGFYIGFNVNGTYLDEELSREGTEDYDFGEVLEFNKKK